MADINNPIHYSDLIVPDDAIERLIEQLNELNAVYGKTLDQVKKEAEGLIASLKKVSGATAEGRSTTREAATEAERLAQKQKELRNAQAQNVLEIAKLKREQREANEIAKLTERLNSSAAGSYNRLSAQYSLNKMRLNQMSEAERQAAERTEGLVTKTKQLYEQMKKLQAETGKMQLNVGNYPKILQGVAGGLGLATTAMGAAMLGTTALKDAIGDSVNVAKDFNTSLSVLQAITGNTKDELADLEKQARELGATTTFTASEVVQLQTELAKLGYKNEDILNMTDSVLRFAQATGAGLAEAASVAGGALRAFGLDTSHTQEIVDKLAAATTNSALQFADFSTILSTVAPIANAFGLKIEDLLTLMGMLKNANFDASSAATATRNILLKLVNTNGDLAKSLGRPVTNIEELIAGLKSLNAAGIDLATSFELTDTRSVSAFNTFLQTADGAMQLRDTINEANGAALQMSQTMTDNLEGDVKTLTSAWQEFMLVVNGGQGILRTFIQGCTDLIKSISSVFKYVRDDFKALYDQNMDLRVAINGTMAVVGDAWAVLKAILKGALQLATGVSQALVDIFSFNNVKEKLKNTGKNLVSGLKDTWNGLTDSANKNWNRIVSAIETKTDKAAKKIKKTTKELQNVETTPVSPANIVTQCNKGGATAAATKREEERQKRERERIYKMNLQALRKYQDSELDLMDEGFDKKILKTQYQYDRQIEDLLHQQQTEENLTKEASEAITKTIETLIKRRNKAISDLTYESKMNEYKLEKEALQTQLRGMKENSQEAYELQLQINELELEAALEANKKKVEGERQSEALITAMYSKNAEKIKDNYVKAQLELFDIEQEFKESEFDLLQTSEEKKTQFQLKAERDRLKKILELNEQAGTKLSATEVATMQNRIKKIDDELKTYEKLGTKMSTRADWGKSLQEAADYTSEIMKTVTDARVKMAEAAVAATEKEVEAAKKTLETEREAAANGYANNQEMAQKEFELAKENQRKALDEQKKAQKRQQVIDTLTQISSLVTASANMWRDLGFPAAIAGIATMWASFAASKIMGAKLAKQNTEEYGEGTVELLEGGSHASGHDIDLGVKKDGTRRRAEGGEFFAVINKRNSRRYRRQIPDIINSLNDGSFGSKYLNAYDAANANGVGLNVALAKPTDVSVLEGEVRKIREQGETRTYIDARGAMVTKYKNVTRRIR